MSAKVQVGQRVEVLSGTVVRTWVLRSDQSVWAEVKLDSGRLVMFPVAELEVKK